MVSAAPQTRYLPRWLQAVIFTVCAVIGSIAADMVIQSLTNNLAVFAGSAA